MNEQEKLREAIAKAQLRDLAKDDKIRAKKVKEVKKDDRLIQIIVVLLVGLAFVALGQDAFEGAKELANV